MLSKSETSFFKHITIASIIVFVIASYPVLVYASPVQQYSIICGYLIGLLNAIAGYILTNFAFSKPVKVFMVVVFGGMGIRMIVIVTLLLLLLYFAKLDEVSLVASVFFFYTLFAAIEINYLHKNQLKEKALKQSQQV